MNRSNILLLLISLLIGSSIIAQTNCDSLQKENEALKKALNLLKPVKTVTTSKIDFNLVSCTGNTKEQTVELIITLVNHEANKTVDFLKAVTIDIEGNEYGNVSIHLGSGGRRNTVYTETPVKASFLFKSVLPKNAPTLKLIAIEFYSNGSSSFEYRDIPVHWQ